MNKFLNFLKLVFRKQRRPTSYNFPKSSPLELFNHFIYIGKTVGYPDWFQFEVTAIDYTNLGAIGQITHIGEDPSWFELNDTVYLQHVEGEYWILFKDGMTNEECVRVYLGDSDYQGIWLD